MTSSLLNEATQLPADYFLGAQMAVEGLQEHVRAVEQTAWTGSARWSCCNGWVTFRSFL